MLKLKFTVEMEQDFDLDGISKLVGSNWTHRKNILGDQSDDCEYTMVRSEDGYWRTIVRKIKPGRS